MESQENSNLTTISITREDDTFVIRFLTELKNNGFLGMGASTAIGIYKKFETSQFYYISVVIFIHSENHVDFLRVFRAK